jgi:hypothetical protein
MSDRKEEHRRILRKGLPGKAAKQPSFKKYLLEMPNAGSDIVFDRMRDAGRTVII